LEKLKEATGSHSRFGFPFCRRRPAVAFRGRRFAQTAK
jgi:hypothetical protein